MNEVAVIGVGQTIWGKYPDKSNEELAREAILNALKDANLEWKDINYIVSGIDPYAGYQWLLAGSTIQAHMGYLGIPGTSIYNACATGAFAMDIGRAFILAGLYDVVLCVGSFKAPGGFFPTTGRADDPANRDLQRFRLLGKTNPSMFAFQAMRRMYNYGTTEEDIAYVKVKNSKHGKLNPNARYRREYTLEEVLASPMVAYPLRLYEIAATSDGAAAVILSSMKKAKQMASKSVLLASVFGPQPKYPSMDIGLSDLATQSEVSKPAGEEHAHEKQVAQGAMDMAGIGPKDLDFAEVYDLTTEMELDWIEDIGICKPGEADRLTREGNTTIGGKIPINTSGGVSSSGESIPAQALLQACELVIQLRDTAGQRQVKNAKAGLAINKGLGNSISCFIMKC